MIAFIVQKEINEYICAYSLQELVKYSTRLGENCDDLQKALELMLGIPHRATDNKFISNIEGYKGNIHKLGRLLTHVGICVLKDNNQIRKHRRIKNNKEEFIPMNLIFHFSSNN